MKLLDDGTRYTLNTSAATRTAQDSRRSWFNRMIFPVSRLYSAVDGKRMIFMQAAFHMRSVFQLQSGQRPVQQFLIETDRQR